MIKISCDRVKDQSVSSTLPSLGKSAIIKTMSRKKLYQQKIEKVVAEFKKIRPEKIILYGSLAAGKIRKDSDIDICVIKKTGDVLKTRRQLSSIIWDKKIGFEPEIDIRVYPPEIYYDWLERKDSFIEEIDKGKVLYEI